MAFIQRHLSGILLILLTVVITARPARAQAAPPPPPQFRVVAMSDVENFFFDVEKKQQVLYAGVGAFSPLYPTPASREVLFYKEQPNPDPKLPPIKVPVARAQLPAGNPGPFLILLNRNPAGEALEFNAVVFDHSLAEHPANTYRVFNFSKRRLAVELAGKSMVLARGLSEKTPYPHTRKAWLKVAADEGAGGWLLVSSSPHSVGTDSRTTIFLVDIPPSPLDPEPKGIVARRFREAIYTDDQGVPHIR